MYKNELLSFQQKKSITKKKKNILEKKLLSIFEKQRSNKKSQKSDIKTCQIKKKTRIKSSNENLIRN